MKRNKKSGFEFLLLIVMVMLMTFRVFAQGKIDMNRENLLTLICKYGDTYLEGAEFSMYKVADVNEYGVYSISNAMKDYPISLNFMMQYTDEEWSNWAVTLMNLISADENIKPDDSATTDKNGVVTLTAPSAGMYLVVGNPHDQGNWIYKTKAALFALPSMDCDKNTWTYEIKAEPKADVVPKENPESLKVKKIWNDAGYSYRRPNEITVELRKDGELYDTVVLSKENGWSYTWRNMLDADANWTVAEKKVPSEYRVSMKTNGITITITNTTGSKSGGGGDDKTSNDPTPSYDKKIVEHDTPSSILDVIEDRTISLVVLPQTGTTWWFVFILFCVSVLFFVMDYIKNYGCGLDEK